MNNKKQFPALFDISQLKPFVEKNSEVPKDEIIHRCEGSVDYSVFQIIKQLVFYSIGKDSNDNLYLI